MSLEKKVNDAIKSAMRAKDKATLRGLRAIKAAILLAKTEKGGSGELTETAEMKLLAKLMKQRKDNLVTYKAGGRDDLCAKESEEIAVIQQFLPQQMEETELRAYLKNLINETGASSMRDMGKVMGTASKQLAGKAEGRLISTIVKELLQNA